MIAKPRPKLLKKRQRKAEIAAIDRAENAKVKARSRGQCEARIVYWQSGEVSKQFWRCPNRGSHVHHLISGIGRRNVGKSIEAEHKIHVCSRCHDEIHGHVLKPVNQYERDAAATVRYERVR